MTDENVLAAMEHFGVGPHDFVRAETCAESLEAFQKTMKRRYRVLAKTLHPDQGGDEELFKAVSAVMNEVNDMRVREGPVYRSLSPRRRVKWAVHFRVETV